ncbi:MAG: hypothetical protein ABWY56_06090 [Propionibacteriaceae bacterium]
MLLADCDPGAHQAVLAGYLAGQSANGKGLLRVAEAHRDGRPLRDVIVDQTIPLATDSTHSRLFLPGFNKPGSAALFGGVWLDLAEAFDRLDDAGIDVIVDAGRMGSQGPPGPLMEYAALTGLVLRSNLRSVMSARVHGSVFEEHARMGPRDRETGLLVIGDGEPYGKREISKALGLPVLACIALDPLSAQHLSDGRPRPRKFDASPLTKSLHTTAASLHDTMQRAVDKIRS